MNASKTNQHLSWVYVLCTVLCIMYALYNVVELLQDGNATFIFSSSQKKDILLAVNINTNEVVTKQGLIQTSNTDGRTRISMDGAMLHTTMKSYLPTCLPAASLPQLTTLPTAQLSQIPNFSKKSLNVGAYLGLHTFHTFHILHTFLSCD